MSDLLMGSLPRFGRAEWSLVGVTCLWSCTFLVTRLGLPYCPVLEMVALRFAVAALLLALVSYRGFGRLTRTELEAGGVVGLVIAIGSILQTTALKTTPSSMVAFLTAFYVPLVPLFQLTLMRRAPNRSGWTGALLGFLGLVTIAGPVGMVTWRDEAFGIGAAACFALEIVLIGYYARRVDPCRFTVAHLIVVAVAALGAMPMLGQVPSCPPWRVIACVSFLGAASAAVQLVTSWAQKAVAPTRATVIYAIEPLWAGLVGALAGETVTAAEGLGAILIIGGVVIAALPPRRRRPALYHHVADEA